jgi:hypothetical protein
MVEFDLLQTISQISAGFAGFTAIIVTFRPMTDWGEDEKLNLIHFLRLSIGVVLLALIPIALSTHQTFSSSLWRFSNGAIGIYHLFLLGWILARATRISAFQELGNIVFAILSCIGTSIALVNLAVALGYFGSYEIIIYLFALIWLLTMTLVNFVAILLQSIKQP